MNHSIPQSLVATWQRHMKRLADNVRCESTADSRTADLLRLVRKDIRAMEKYIKNGLSSHD